MSTITFRASREVDRALDELITGTHQDRFTVICHAILEAWHAHRADRLRNDAAALSADADDRAEIRVVREEMDSLQARGDVTD